MFRHFIFSPKHFDFALIIRAANEDDASAAHFSLFFPTPRGGKSSSFRRRFSACPASAAMRFDILVALLLQFFHRLILKSRPDLRLPKSVVTFNAILQAVLTRWRKNRSHLQAQTQTDDSAYRITVLPRSREAIVVIELGILRQAPFPPVRQNGGQSGFGAESRFDKRGNQTAVQRDSVEDFDFAEVANEEAFNKIEGIEFGSPSGDLRQIPTLSRRLAANSSASVEDPMPLKDVANRSQGRDLFLATSRQFTSDCQRPKLTQVGLMAELLANLKNQILHVVVGAIGDAMRGRELVTEVNAVKALAASTINPELDRRRRDVKLLRNLAQRLTATNGSDDFASPFFKIAFLLTASTSIISFLLYYCSTGACTLLFDRCLHLSLYSLGQRSA